MGTSSAPVFPYPTGQAGKEPVDPVAGKPGHFAWSRWIKEFVKRLDRESVKISGDTMTGPLRLTNGNVEVQLFTDNTGMTVTGPIQAQDPTRADDLTTRQYVDARVPVYLQVTMTADSSGWATPAGLKAGAVVYSLLDVSATPAPAQLLLNASTNAIYLGANATRTIRIWYV
jgi:hypothetical protein